MSELQHSHTSDDFGHFFKGWIRNPLAMGAFAPSGKSLAKLMAKDVGVGSRVVELGAGTGTRYGGVAREAASRRGICISSSATRNS